MVNAESNFQNHIKCESFATPIHAPNKKKDNLDVNEFILKMNPDDLSSARALVNHDELNLSTYSAVSDLSMNQTLSISPVAQIP